MLVLADASHQSSHCCGPLKSDHKRTIITSSSRSAEITRYEIGRCRLLDEVVAFVKSEASSKAPSSMDISLKESAAAAGTADVASAPVTKFKSNKKSFKYPFSVEWLAPPGIITQIGEGKSDPMSLLSLKNRGCGVGLVNRNNACFLNATIQALTYCPILLQDSLCKKHKSRCSRAVQSLFCGFCEFEEHISHQLLINADSTRVKPENHHHPTGFNNKKEGSHSSPFKKQVKLFSHEKTHNQFKNAREITFYPAMVKDFLQQYKISIKRQHCAYEFFTLFLDWLKRYDLPQQLEAVFKANRIPQEQLFTTYLGQLFGSIVQVRKTCQNCRKVTYRNEVVYDFVLTTTKVRDATDAFQKYFETESFSGPNCLDCDDCSQRCPFLWEKKLIVPPNVLVLCFRRASWNSEFGKASHSALQKDAKPINVPDNFDISKVMNFVRQSQGITTSDAQSTSGFESLKNIYRPTSAIIHLGSPISGHYINISRGLNSHWYMLDDEIVTQISDKKADDLLKTAFLIFLARVDTAVPTPSRDEVTIFKDRVSAETLETLRPTKRQNEIPLDLVTGFKLSRLNLTELANSQRGDEAEDDAASDTTTTSGSSVHRDSDSNASSTRADTNYSSMASDSSAADTSPKESLSPTSSSGTSPSRRRRHVIGKRLKKLFVYARVIKRRLRSASGSPTNAAATAGSDSPFSNNKLPDQPFDNSNLLVKKCDSTHLLNEDQWDDRAARRVAPSFALLHPNETAVIPCWETESADCVQEFQRKSLHLVQLQSKLKLPISKRQIHDAEYDRGKIKKKKRLAQSLSGDSRANNNRLDFDQISANIKLHSSGYI